MLYFKFNKKPFRGEAPIRKRKKTLWGKLMDKVYRMGRANPDFDHKIIYVAKWYIEYDNREDYDTSWREIGLDVNNRVIVKMPDDNNSGFWLDTNATLKDFKEKFHLKPHGETGLIKNMGNESRLKGGHGIGGGERERFP